jgi:hypothetical protein
VKLVTLLLAASLSTPPPAPAAHAAAAPAWVPESTLEGGDDRPTRPPSRPRGGWQRRHRALVIATGTTGALVVASAIAGAALGIEIRKAVDRCSYATYTQCEATRARVKQLMPPTYAVAAILGASLVGVIVSGIMLGVHRRRRPDFARANGPRLALDPGGMRLHF